MAGQYWFPSMSVSEIVEAFSGWGLSVSPQAVVHPTSDFVTKIYTACLQQVTSITDAELQRPSQSAANTLDYTASNWPNCQRKTNANIVQYRISTAQRYHRTFCLCICEYHYFSPVASLIQQCNDRQRFARAAKIVDFTAKDLAFPEPDRTRSIFSAFINLVKFSEQCESFIKGLKSQSTSVTKERDRTAEKRVEAEKRLATIKYVGNTTFRIDR